MVFSAKRCRAMPESTGRSSVGVGAKASRDKPHCVVQFYIQFPYMGAPAPCRG